MSDLNDANPPDARHLQPDTQDNEIPSAASSPGVKTVISASPEHDESLFHDERVARSLPTDTTDFFTKIDPKSRNSSRGSGLSNRENPPSPTTTPAPTSGRRPSIFVVGSPDSPQSKQQDQDASPSRVSGSRAPQESSSYTQENEITIKAQDGKKLQEEALRAVRESPLPPVEIKDVVDVVEEETMEVEHAPPVENVPTIAPSTSATSQSSILSNPIPGQPSQNGRRESVKVSFREPGADSRGGSRSVSQASTHSDHPVLEAPLPAVAQVEEKLEVLEIKERIELDSQRPPSGFGNVNLNPSQSSVSINPKSTLKIEKRPTSPAIVGSVVQSSLSASLGRGGSSTNLLKQDVKPSLAAPLESALSPEIPPVPVQPAPQKPVTLPTKHARPITPEAPAVVVQPAPQRRGGIPGQTLESKAKPPPSRVNPTPPPNPPRIVNATPPPTSRIGTSPLAQNSFTREDMRAPSVTLDSARADPVATSSPGNMSRTQQKMMLQRMAFLASDSNYMIHPKNQIRLTKEMERVDREYWNTTRRWNDPIQASLERVQEKLGLKPPELPQPIIEIHPASSSLVPVVEDKPPSRPVSPVKPLREPSPQRPSRSEADLTPRRRLQTQRKSTGGFWAFLTRTK